MAVRGLASRIIDFLGERTIHAAFYEADVAGALECILEAWLGPVEPPEKPISDGRKVGPPVIEDLILKSVEIPFRLLDSVVGGEGEEEPIAAPHRSSVAESVVHPEQRGEIILVGGQGARAQRH